MKQSKSLLNSNLFMVGAFICGLLFTTLMTSCKGSTSPPKFDKAKKTMSALYPRAKKISWGVDAHGNHEAQFKLGVEKFRADFLPEGKWIETEQSIKWSDLPDEVQDKVKEDFDKDDISELEWVDHHEKGVFYDVEFKRKGKNYDVEYNANGKRLN